MSLTKTVLLALGVYVPVLVMAQQASPMPGNVSPGGAGIASPGAPPLEAAQPIASGQRTRVGFSGSYENLTGAQPSWNDYSLRLNRNFGSRKSLDAALTETRRFDRRDSQLSAMYASPITSKLSGSIGGDISPTHRVLARYSLGGTLQYEVAPAWLVHGGLKTTEFNDVRVNQGLMMLEHYFSDFSLALAVRPTRAFGSSETSAELRGGYYYGDGNSFSVSLSGGREATNIGTGIVLADVQTIAIFGRHWLDRNWSTHYVLGHTRQGDFYTRNGISLGIDYAF